MFTEIIKDKWENKNKNDKAAIELWNSKADYFGSYELENVQNERFIQIIKENNLINKDSFILDSAMDKNKLGRYSFISSNPFKVLKYKDSKENPFYTISFYKMYNDYICYSSEMLVKINKYDGSLIGYSNYSTNNGEFLSDINISEDESKYIFSNYMKELGFEGEIIGKPKIEYRWRG